MWNENNRTGMGEHWEMRTAAPIKLNWLSRAVQVHNFHVAQLRDEKEWTLEKTAEALNRSIGSVSQDIKIAKWCKTHEKQLARFRSMSDALSFIRDKEREMNGREIEI